MNLLEQVEQLASDLRFAEYIRNKLTGARLVHEHERVTFERILRLAIERVCTACRGYGQTMNRDTCMVCGGNGAMDVAKAHAETTPATESCQCGHSEECFWCSSGGARSVPLVRK